PAQALVVEVHDVEEPVGPAAGGGDQEEVGLGRRQAVAVEAELAAADHQAEVPRALGAGRPAGDQGGRRQGQGQGSGRARGHVGGRLPPPARGRRGPPPHPAG
ncbi:hypothetical protein RZS08_62135, partial [Arthrospira platensis SPKY1]|nr:hypothetical protein [Arthrospira platensis SPKY1]